MGLDMYAFSTSKKINVETDFKLADDDERELIHQWRKHPNLHGWFKKLYFKKGGKDSEFNTNNVIINNDDLDKLEDAILNNKLPHTEGFFFGRSSLDDDERQDDLDFIKAAREEIKAGRSVYYTSWW